MKAKNTGVIAKSETLEDIYSFYATYENTTATALDPFYYVNINGDMSLGNNGSVTVGPYRWIMRVENKFGGSPAYVKAVRIYDGEEDVATAVSEVKNEGVKSEKSIYNLAGQRMSRLQKGLNIVSGKKVLVK